MSALPSIINDTEAWTFMMGIPALIGAIVAHVERKLPTYSIAAMLTLGTFAVASERPDEQIVDRRYVRLAADESRAFPQLRPLIAKAMKDDRMTLTEYRTIKKAHDQADHALKAAKEARDSASAEEVLKTIEQETAR